jgi:hypothetical protein
MYGFISKILPMHSTWPRLKHFGHVQKDSGYRLDRMKGATIAELENGCILIAPKLWYLSHGRDVYIPSVTSIISQCRMIADAGQPWTKHRSSPCRYLALLPRRDLLHHLDTNGFPGVRFLQTVELLDDIWSSPLCPRPADNHDKARILLAPTLKGWVIYWFLGIPSSRKPLRLSDSFFIWCVCVWCI